LSARSGAGTILIAMSDGTDRKKQNARRGLAVYFALLFLGSGYFEWRIAQTGESIGKTSGLVLALMYIPAVASIVARLTFRDAFDDVSFRFGGSEGIRAMALAWTYPAAVGFLAYGTAWASGLATFRLPLPPESHLYTNSATANLLTSFLLTATLGTAVSGLSAFGEELGWRGYMLTRLIVAGVPKPVLVSGLIWALWHVPLILSGQYAAGLQPQFSAMLFVVGTLADAYLAAYVRLRSGSVWPAVMYHGAWNAIIQGTFDRASVGTSAAIGESGWLTATIAVIVVLFVTRGTWKLEQRPGQPLILPSGKRPSIRTV
jgi:membrane protease YdiL (CAAX protease family)